MFSEAGGDPGPHLTFYEAFPGDSTTVSLVDGDQDVIADAAAAADLIVTDANEHTPGVQDPVLGPAYPRIVPEQYHEKARDLTGAFAGRGLDSDYGERLASLQDGLEAALSGEDDGYEEVLAQFRDHVDGAAGDSARPYHVLGLFRRPEQVADELTAIRDGGYGGEP